MSQGEALFPVILSSSKDEDKATAERKYFHCKLSEKCEYLILTQRGHI